MQQSVPSNPRNRHGLRALVTIAALAGLGGCVAGLTGCGPDAQVYPAPAPKPHDGVSLALSCPHPALADALAPMVRSWEARSGAKVTLTTDAMNPADRADVGVLPVGDLGAWANPGHLAPVPAKFRAGEHPIRWFEFLSAYGDRFCEWGAQTYGVPLTGGGQVLVYRADRFADAATAADFFAARKRPLGPPVSWEELAEVAAFFAARDKKPSLPPLPADADKLLELFSRVASSMDRPTLSDKDLDDPRKGQERLGFQFVLQTGAPRVGERGFAAAAEWLAGLHAAGCLPPGGADDPAAALADGRAALALLSLDQLAKLPREGGAVAPRFAVAAVPGARWYFGANGVRVEAVGQGANYVPHFADGRLAVVRARCPHPDAAFDLLAELCGPERGAELVATPGLGAGPTRGLHLTPDRALLWLGYGFDAPRSKALQEALRYNTGPTVKNPTFELRGPDRADLTRGAGDALRKLGTGGKPSDVLTELTGAWTALDAKTDRAKLVRWRQFAAGVN